MRDEAHKSARPVATETTRPQQTKGRDVCSVMDRVLEGVEGQGGRGSSMLFILRGHLVSSADGYD